MSTFILMRLKEKMREGIYYIVRLLHIDFRKTAVSNVYCFMLNSSAGFGLSLLAESTTGVTISSELIANAGDTPEDIGLKCAKMLYNEISRGGCVDTRLQGLCLILMSLGTEDVGRVKFGKISPQSLQMFRDIKSIIGVVFKITESGEDRVSISCIGSGISNITKKTT